MVGDTFRVVMAVLGSLLSVFALGVPILFGILTGAVMGPSRGRPKLVAYNLGVWFSVFYVIYLLFQPKVRYMPNGG